MLMNKKNQKGIAVLFIPILVVMLGFVITAPLFVFSLVKSLSISNVYHFLTSSDAAGVSYDEPGASQTIAGGKLLEVPCIDQDNSLQCGATSTAMVVAFLTGKRYTATQFIELAKKQGVGGGPNSVNIDGALSRFTNEKWKSINHNPELAKKAINAGYPVVIYTGMYKSSKNSYGHILVITGYDSAGYFYLNNPAIKAYGGCKKIKKLWGDWKGCHSSGCKMVIPSKIN